MQTEEKKARKQKEKNGGEGGNEGRRGCVFLKKIWRVPLEGKSSFFHFF
jgi:hypothetical protein